MEQTEISSSGDPSSFKSSRHGEEGDSALKRGMLKHLSWVLVLTVVIAIGALYLMSAAFRNEVATMWDVLSSGDQGIIREYINSFGAWAPVASVLLMVSQVVLAPVPASVIQLANGVVFGIAGGAILNLIGQMAGATVAFFISRSLGRTAAERFAGRVDEHGVIEHWIDRWGGKALLLVRMIPGMPSDFVSYLMGLTNMPAKRYILVSFVGYIPQSIAYAWLGDYATDWFWWIVLAGFGISGIIGIVVWAMRRFRRRPSEASLKIKTEQDAC